MYGLDVESQVHFILTATGKGVTNVESYHGKVWQVWGIVDPPDVAPTIPSHWLCLQQHLKRQTFPTPEVGKQKHSVHAQRHFSVFHSFKLSSDMINMC